MKCNPKSAWSAYSWSKMDNSQRHEVVKLLEQEYGSDFAHAAHFGNRYSKPAVGAGKLLSKKKDLTKDALDFYLESLLDTIVKIRSLVPIDVHLDVVRKSKPSDGTKFGVYLVAPNGKSMVESIHFSEGDALAQMKRLDKHLNFSSLGAKREVRKLSKAEASSTYDVLIWDYDKDKYVPHPEFPIHLTRESAIDRASHDTRCGAAWSIQWETWKAAKCKAPEEYDYFEKENVLHFDKKALLKGHANPRRSDCWNLSETPYWNKLTSSAVDEKFLDFCSKL